MITVNSVSGGRSSAYMAIHNPADVDIFALVCIDTPSKTLDSAIVRYANEKLEKSGAIAWGEFVNTAEHPKTLQVMMELEQVLGREITWVRRQSFDKVIDEGTKTRLPSWARRYCTVEMKIRPIAEYCYWHFGKVIMNIGFRLDDSDRITPDSLFKLQVSSPLYKNNSEDYKFEKSKAGALPLDARLNTWSKVDWRKKAYPIITHTHTQIIQYMQAFPQLSFPKNSNCQGCFHKPQPILKINWQEAPEQMQWFSQQEAKGKGTWLDPVSGVKITYEKIKELNFTEELFSQSALENFTMCNSGSCTD